MEEETRKVSAKDLLFSDDATARRLPPICPQCGTWNPPEAKFCKKDGVKLPERGGRGDVQPVKNPVPPTEQEAGDIGISGERPLPHGSNTHLYLFIIIGIFLVVAGGSYRYFFTGKSGAVQEVQKAPEGKGAVREENDASVSSPVEPGRTAEPAVPAVSPRPVAQPHGEARKTAGRKPAVRYVREASAKPKKEAEDVKPGDERPDPAKTGEKLNRLLRSSGMGRVTAEVGGDMTAVLKGTVSSGKDRARALSLARSVREVKGVRDIIFVIEP